MRIDFEKLLYFQTNLSHDQIGYFRVIKPSGKLDSAMSQEIRIDYRLGSIHKNIRNAAAYWTAQL
ncbi:MAG: hypothetical protein ACREFF_15445 [Candidatus Udaeobacter sp.]